MTLRSTGSRAAIRAPERSLAKALGAVLGLGASFVFLSLALPHPSGGSDAALLTIGVAMAVAAPLTWFYGSRLPVAGLHLVLALAVAATGALTYASSVAAGGYGSIFVWSMLLAGYFFSRRVAIAHLAWALVVYAVTLATVESTAGYSPVTRWLITAVSLTVVLGLTSEIVHRRERADARARRFFDLSQDMLSTMDLQGRCIEINSAWKTCLGYRPEDMEGRPLLEITHPGDAERAMTEAGRVFEGDASAGLETRVRAKDGSWHWLRSTATYAPDEQIVYARSTDVTELKQVEAEREELLREVESLARSDALTGLPNRRALEEELPRDMVRASRGAEPLCVAMVDVDHFKAYNDANGHLAGDGLLRECAIAWDSALRGEDTISRVGGEEFVVVLPRCAPEQAGEIVERLRSATPDGQTVSAGLALWDGEESVSALIGRADAALYEAKENGRDRLVAAIAS